jgi:hypothetical protein
MPEETQTSSFTHTDPRIQAALAYTMGDVEKASKMASGEYQDIKVIKGKYAVESRTLFGNFMVFCNIEYSVFVNVSIIQYKDPAPFGEMKPTSGWKEYFRACERTAGLVTLEDTSGLVPHISASLSGYDIFSDLSAGDEANATNTLTEIISKYMDNEPVSVELSFESASSLLLFEERIPMAEIKPKGAAAQQQAAPADNRPEIEKQYTFVVEAKAIVSPLKGKRVVDLVPGDQVILLLVNRDGASIKIAEAIGAFDEKRNFRPIKGRFVGKVPVEKIGFYLYCALAKNAVARIPEEGNVQIEIAEATPRVTMEEVQKGKKDVDRNIILYIALLLGLAAIAGLIIFALI